jgi:hypothetical protein
MKKIILIFLITFLSINCYSQIIFEKGYFINDKNERIDCLIKNMEWKNNPIKFKYKLLENSDIKTASIHNVKEFGIDSTEKYLRAKVKIDRSGSNISQMSSNRNPIFEEEQLFLKVLVEGDASLYQYKEKNLIRYFFKILDSDIKQLVHKFFLFDNDEVNENNLFRQQLFLNLKSKDISKDEIENIEYKKDELVEIFVKYNESKNAGYFNFEKKQKKSIFHLNINPGLNYSNLTLQDFINETIYDNFDNELTYSLGIEAEFILPFHKNKWAIILQPTYQFYRTEKLCEVEHFEDNYKEKVKIDYNSIELPIGIRHYFHLNNHSKIFLNTTFIYDFNINSSILIDPTLKFYSEKELKIDPVPNFAIGLGYNYNEKLSLELRYQTKQQLLNKIRDWSAYYNTMSLILGYKLF